MNWRKQTAIKEKKRNFSVKSKKKKSQALKVTPSLEVVTRSLEVNRRPTTVFVAATVFPG